MFSNVEGVEKWGISCEGAQTSSHLVMISSPLHRHVCSDTIKHGIIGLYSGFESRNGVLMSVAMLARSACIARNNRQLSGLLVGRRLSTAPRTTMMKTRSFPASFVRGGTSNGLIINRSDLPKNETDWQPILSSAMGSPDSFGRQLDGMGSGISSTSKICVISPSAREDADVDYTFVQVGIKDGSLDMAGNCGNMSSAVGR
jgi:hypothetical protein